MNKSSPFWRGLGGCALLGLTGFELYTGQAIVGRFHPQFVSVKSDPQKFQMTVMIHAGVGIFFLIWALFSLRKKKDS
jgi:hypothetical protein